MKKQMFKIVIPSHGRAEAIGKHTLKYLRNTNVDQDEIYVFVSNEEEQEKYEKTNPGIKTVVAAGTKSLVAKRKFISEYFPSGTRLTSFDDDVSNLKRLVLLDKLENTQKPLDFPCKLEPYTNLKGFIEDGWELAEERNIGLWGAYQIDNKGFLHPKVTTGLRFIMGHLMSFIAGDPAFNDIEKYPCKDDVYLSLWHYVNGNGTLRFDNFSVKSKAHSGAGGTCDDLEAKLELNNKTVERICSDFPDLAFVKMRRTNDEWLSRYKEIRLKSINTETIDMREKSY